MLRTVSSLPLCRAFDAGLRRRTFPSDAASLLPGLLAATRTGLPPAGDDELFEQQEHRYVTVSPPVLLGARENLTQSNSGLSVFTFRCVSDPGERTTES